MDSPNFSGPQQGFEPTPAAPAQWVPAGNTDLFVQHQPHEGMYHDLQKPPTLHEGAPVFHPQESAHPRADSSLFHPSQPGPPPSMYTGGTSTNVSLNSQPRNPPPSTAPSSGDPDDEINPYMHIPCVMKLYQAHYNLLKTVTRLFEQNQELQDKIKQLEQQLEQRPLVGPPLLYRRAISGSLAPSDSLSQRPPRPSTGSGSIGSRAIHPSQPLLQIPQSQPVERPADLPFEILWKRDDCKLDQHGARPEKSNSGRPRMKCAIRDKDGNQIDSSTYKLINKTAARQVAMLIQEEEERLKGELPMDKMTKNHFETCRAKQWMHAIAVLEAEHPILAYAAAHWKAEQLLMKCLTTRRSSNKNRGAGRNSKKAKRAGKGKEAGGTGSTSDEDDSEDEGEDTSDKGKVGEKRKRTQSISTSGPPETTIDQDTTVNSFTNSATSMAEESNKIDMDSSLAGPSQNKVRQTPRKKRHGKQAAFLVINEAATSLGDRQAGQMLPPPPPRASPLSLISVTASYSGIKDVFTSTFNQNMPPNAIKLLDTLSKIPETATSNSGSPSSSVLELIERIESADPNAPDIDEDDTNIGWGHSQFTSGGLTFRTVLQSWMDIGNVKSAYRLLAACLKTCLVARHLCFVNKIQVPSMDSGSTPYISDSYLREVIEILYNFQDQGSALPPATVVSSAVATATVQSQTATSTSTMPPTPTGQDQDANDGSKRLERLHADELKTWMSGHSIPLGAHNKRKKHDLIATILRSGSEKVPTDEDITRIVGQRASHKRGAAPKPT